VLDCELLASLEVRNRACVFVAETGGAFIYQKPIQQFVATVNRFISKS
jgi:hypothetical protein